MPDALVDTLQRPFASLSNEADWVALREIVPSATAPQRTTSQFGGRDFTVVTSLPDSWAAVHRDDGQVLVALQTLGAVSDVSRAIAAAALAALDSEPGTSIPTAQFDEAAPRLQDVLDPSVAFEPTVHDDFEYWVDADAERTAQVEAALQEAADTIVPTRKLASVPSAYWVRMGAREFLRWAMTDDEDALLDALARLHAKRASGFAGGRYVGSFRAEGISIPVWELPRGTEADALEEPAAEFWPTLRAALADESDLSVLERRARAGLVARQVTLR